MENILEVSNLTKNFKAFTLKNVNFQLPRGYIMGFIGPNGSGKSTTIKLVMNLLKKDSGEIKVFGLDNLKHELQIKDRIGFVYDENHFYEELTIREMAKVIAPLYKKWDSSSFRRYLKDFELREEQKIKELSKGMKMKFSLAVALSHEAELFIMDEPTSGLDPLVRSELLEILSALIQDENRAVFFSTHITSDLDKVADYITFIHNGQIVLSESKEHIFDSYSIIKGDRELLDNEIRKLFVGLRENRFGFEGLFKDNGELPKGLRERVVLEKPVLEDILLYTVRGWQNV